MDRAVGEVAAGAHSTVGPLSQPLQSLDVPRRRWDSEARPAIDADRDDLIDALEHDVHAAAANRARWNVAVYGLDAHCPST